MTDLLDGLKGVSGRIEVVKTDTLTLCSYLDTLYDRPVSWEYFSTNFSASEYERVKKGSGFHGNI
jgi:hypothetical protein